MCLGTARTQVPRVVADVPTKHLPTEAAANISLGEDQPVITISSGGSFERVGLRQGQMVDIAVQYPVAKAGRSIVAEQLDGGQVTPGALVVDAEGMIYFQFHAGQEIGVYQVALHDGAQELGLQFWVLDELHPERNPAVINSQN